MSRMTRYPLIAAAVAGALTLGACGAGNGNNGAASADSREDKAFEGALKFSRCMREHGVDFPDPKRVGNGGISIGGPDAKRLKRLRGGGGQADPKLKAAESACQKYLDFGGAGEPMDPAEQARMQDAFFAYARCMRSKGINMPDPKVTSQGVQMRVGPDRQNGPGGSKGPPDSPVFRAADTACHHHLAEVEKFRGGGKTSKGGGPSLESSK
jgi:hypothetical protein